MIEISEVFQEAETPRQDSISKYLSGMGRMILLGAELIKIGIIAMFMAELFQLIS